MSAMLSRSVRWLLLASLVANLAFASWFVLQAPWRHHGGREGRHAPLPQLVDLRTFRRALPPERRDVAEAAFAAHRPALRARIGELFEARRAVRDAIRAEIFDRAALDAAFVRLRAAEAAAAEQAQSVLGDALQQLTPEERRQFSDLVPHRPARADGRREREPRDPPPP